jgi:hypothetical protein
MEPGSPASETLRRRKFSSFFSFLGWACPGWRVRRSHGGGSGGGGREKAQSRGSRGSRSHCTEASHLAILRRPTGAVVAMSNGGDEHTDGDQAKWAVGRIPTSFASRETERAIKNFDAEQDRFGPQRSASWKRPDLLLLGGSQLIGKPSSDSLAPQFRLRHLPGAPLAAQGPDARVSAVPGNHSASLRIPFGPLLASV